MQDLEITWPDGIARFSVIDSPIHLGRSSDAAVPLTEGSISRRHLELIWNGTDWIASDSSTHGTFDPIGVRLAPEWTLSSDTTVRLGGVEGVQVQIRLVPPENAGGSIGSSTAAGSSGPGGLFAPPRQADSDVQAAADPLFPEPRSTSASAAGTPSPPGTTPPAGTPDAPGRPTTVGETAVSAGPHAVPVPPPSPASDRKAAADPVPIPAPAPDAGSLRRSTVLDQSEDQPPPGATGRSSGVLEQSGPASGDRPGSGGVSAPGRTAFSGPGATGGQPAISIDPHSTIISDSTLRLNVGGQDYSFLPGAEVTVGRDPSCLVQLDERHSLVSRKHLRITFQDGFWWLEDFSSKGTYVNSRQLKKPYKAEGAFIANLGDDDAGTPMRVITAGEHRVPRNRNMLAIGGLAAATVIPLIIIAVLLTRGDSSSTEPDFAAAKQSTVMLFGLEGGQGSGFMVADDLILTNQHVAVLSPQMLVGVTRQADEPAEIEYATELVANHPFLDLAVLRISNRAEMADGSRQVSSEPVGDIDLPTVKIGDSADVTIGDRVFNTGFPGRLSITSTDDTGNLRLPSVVATSGEAANFAIWPGCSNPDFELFIPSDSPPGVACSAGGDLRNGVLLASFFSSGQGASGSAVFHDNEVVAVVYAAAADEDNATLSITTQVFADWLQEIIEQNS